MRTLGMRIMVAASEGRPVLVIGRTKNRNKDRGKEKVVNQ